MSLHAVLAEAIVFLVATVLVVPVFERLKASPLVGYLLAGVVIGPIGFGVVAHASEVEHLAELGIMMLMFSVGMELTFERLKVMRSKILLLGFLQILITSMVLGGIGFQAGLSFGAALVVGGGLALSSTAVVLQLLAERHELATRIGRAAMAILLIQDLAIGPLLVLVPVLSAHAGTMAGALGMAFLKAVGVLAFILVMGRLALRPLFHIVARSRTAELFIATILLVMIGTGLTVAWGGLSMALGAFAAGLMLAETEHRHRIMETIQPFRGLLMGLFFMSVGMVIDFKLAYEHFGLIATLTIGMMALKALLLLPLARLAGFNWTGAARLSLILSQGSEFAFVVFGLAESLKVLPSAQAQPLLLALAFSMALTPLLAVLSGWLGRKFEPYEAPGFDMLVKAAHGMQDHVIVAGIGRVGRGVVDRFVKRGVPYLAVEGRRHRVVDAKAAGLAAFHADATDLAVLEAAGIAKAQALVVALGDAEGATHLVATLRYLFPNLRILARARTEAQGRQLTRAGADEVIVERQDAGDRLASAVAVSVDL
ncbi:MAG: cation:proton antiporter [Alphaproteobacteria bacterium]|nr:cation:proton antiporter [Alphaproteobacteria bacterium]